MTVPETYFLRHIDQFRAFSEVALPDALASRASGAHSQSCSPRAVRRARSPTRWPFWCVNARWTPAGTSPSARWTSTRPCWPRRHAAFTRLGRCARLPPTFSSAGFAASDGNSCSMKSIRGAVSFQEVNLAQENAELWAPAFYDVIFCRNVLMYFTPEVAQALVARLTRSLTPDGYLFLGHAETLRGLSNDYHLRHTHDTFYYQRKGAKEDERREPFVDPFNGALRETLIPSCASRAEQGEGLGIGLGENLAGHRSARVGPYPGSHRAARRRACAAGRPGPQPPRAANRDPVAVGAGIAEAGTILGGTGSARSVAGRIGAGSGYHAAACRVADAQRTTERRRGCQRSNCLNTMSSIRGRTTCLRCAAKARGTGQGALRS